MEKYDFNLESINTDYNDIKTELEKITDYDEILKKFNANKNKKIKILCCHLLEINLVIKMSFKG
jgi:hypothetical protein